MCVCGCVCVQILLSYVLLNGHYFTGFSERDFSEGIWLALDKTKISYQNVLWF